MLAKELDVVRLKDGRTATVLEVFEAGKAYLVEVADSKGRTLDMPMVMSDDIEEIVWEFRFDDARRRWEVVSG